MAVLVYTLVSTLIVMVQQIQLTVQALEHVECLHVQNTRPTPFRILRVRQQLVPPALDDAAPPPAAKRAHVPCVRDQRPEALRLDRVGIAARVRASCRIDCGYRQDTEAVEDVLRGAQRDRGAADKVERGRGVEVAAGLAEVHARIIGGDTVLGAAIVEAAEVLLERELGEVRSEGGFRWISEIRCSEGGSAHEVMDVIRRGIISQDQRVLVGCCSPTRKLM